MARFTLSLRLSRETMSGAGYINVDLSKRLNVSNTSHIIRGFLKSYQDREVTEKKEAKQRLVDRR